MILRHGSLGAVANIGDQLFSVGEGNSAAIYVLDAAVIHQEEMLSTRPPGNVDVFAQFNITISPCDEQAAVTPNAKSVRRKPVHADVAHSSIAPHNDISEIFQFGVLRVVKIGDLGRDDLSGCRTGEVQELVKIVRADVRQDAAVPGFLEEPVGNVV